MLKLVIIGIIIATLAYAQGPPPMTNITKVDSLTSLVEKLRRDDTQREFLASTLVNLMWELRLLNAKEAMIYGKEGIALALQNKQFKIAAKGYNYLGVVHIQNGDMASAIDQLFLALELAEKQNIPDEVGYAYLNISMLYRTQGDYGTSRDFTYKSLAVFQDIQLASGLGYASLRLGDVYTDLKQHDSAFTYYRKAYEIRTLLKDSTQLIAPLTLMGSSLIEQKKSSEGLSYLEQALKLAIKLKQKVRISEIQAYIVHAYSATARYKEAIALGEKLYTENRYGWYRIRELVLDGLAQAYQHDGRYKEALEMFTELDNLQDSLRSATVMRSLQHTDANYQLEKKELELELLKSRQSNQNLLISVSVIGMIVLVVLVGVLLSRIRIRRQAQQVLQEKNAQLEEANQFRAGLLRMASHDLKNPLTGILMSTDILPMVIDDNPTQAKVFIDEINSAATRMLKLIIDLLDVAKELTMQIVVEQSDLVPIVRDVISRNEIQAQNKNITVSISAPVSAFADVDRERIEQVFENLISNAIKYTHTGGHVDISISSTTINYPTSAEPLPGWRIAVRDTGQGLHEDDLKNMFKPFHKLSSVPTANEHSTGVGLSIVKQIIDYHAGEIMAESEGKGKGTTFIIKLFQVMPKVNQ